MNDLLKEAIADAKAVRETAMANAKLALEEAFTPKLQSMLSAKLQNEMEEDDVDTIEDEELGMEEEGEIEDLEAIEGEDELEDLEVATEEAPIGDEIEGEEEIGDEVEDELDLESIIKELELEEEDELEVDAEEEEVAIEAVDPTDEEDDELTEEEGEDEEEVDLDEIIAALKEEDEDEDENDPGHLGSDLSKGMSDAGVTLEVKAAELKEAYGVIKFLKDKINEINLLNAKLLFSNKLFKAYNLNESQKIKVIENFDRATTLREVKLVYATIAESYANGNKRTVNEGTASKTVASTAPSKQVITEGNELANRFKKLAGLIR